jgi:hypothetical protein
MPARLCYIERMSSDGIGWPLLTKRSLVRGVAGACAVSWVAAALAKERELEVDARAWRIVPSESGPVNYYSVATEAGKAFIRARYVPPMKTAVLGWQVPDADRRRVRKLRWAWRARTLPTAGDECTQGKGDSAAVVYLTWKRGLRYYTLKYVWSAMGVKGRVCARKRNLFVAQDTIIMESGPPLNTWRSVELDPSAEFRKHFEDGDMNAEVPDFIGIGIMSDGDQTKSESSADYGPFKLVR